MKPRIPNTPDENPNGGISRRKALRATLGAIVIPAAGLAGGCVGPPHPGSRTGRGTLTGSRRFPTLPPQVKDRVKWDFDRLVFEVKTILENGGTDVDALKFVSGPQEVLLPNPGVPPVNKRKLAVHVEPPIEFKYGTDTDGNKVVIGFVVRGCMLRISNNPHSGADIPDTPRPFKDCADAEHQAAEHKTNFISHLVYSSSSSSSRWG